MPERLCGTVEVLQYVDGQLRELADVCGDVDSAAVREVLVSIGAGLRNPEWAQVNVEEMLEEKHSLERALLAERMNSELATLLWESSVELMREQLESTRNLAVRLEGELARVEAGGV